MISAVSNAAIDMYARTRETVSYRPESVPRAHITARAIGVGRLVLGATFLAAPRFSVRVLGVDSATAKRMTFLARMAAARDIGLGLGTLGAGTAAAPWLLAGAGADAVDAVVIAGALRSGTSRGLPAAGIVAGAAATAAVGVWAALTLRRAKLD
ncbi:MAG: hypothetical protein ACRDVG_02625 [Jatrophihabitantaceae bacterium]